MIISLLPDEEVNRNETMVTAVKSSSELTHKIESLTQHLEQAKSDSAELKKALSEELRLTQEQLRQTVVELALSNRELEQFASTASHDLQEPLHIVTNFLDLLALKYKDQLDQTAQEYIHYAQKAALQAQALIRDLLAYARIGTRIHVETVDMNEALDQALLHLKLSLDECNPEITRENLPQVKATKSHIVQVFQNILSNAIKYRSERPLTIDIRVRDEGKKWVFSIEDNGIGIESKHIDQVFEMFRRLHSKSKYPGSGIGLATCKKMVEYSGGKIWVESNPNVGSKFFFSIPKK